MTLFGPPGCTATSMDLRPNVHCTVRPIVLILFRSISLSAGAFSGRPAIAGRLLYYYWIASQARNDKIEKPPDWAVFINDELYIIPGIPPGICAAGFSSGISAITAPVVNITPAVDAAAIIAVLTTLAGSIMPDFIMSTYSPVWAL